MKMHKVNCKEVISHICDNLGEEINSAKCVEIKAHLEECNCCSQYLKSVDKTIELYKMYNVQINDDIHKRLMDYLEQGK